MIADDRLKPGSVGLNCVMHDGMECCSMSEVLAFGDASGELLKVKIANADVFKDDLTGQVLPAEPVRAARQKEMDYVKSKGLWVKKPIKDCWDRTGRPPVTVRWVDTK